MKKRWVSFFLVAFLVGCTQGQDVPATHVEVEQAGTEHPYDSIEEWADEFEKKIEDWEVEFEKEIEEQITKGFYASESAEPAIVEYLKNPKRLGSEDVILFSNTLEMFRPENEEMPFVDETATYDKLQADMILSGFIVNETPMQLTMKIDYSKGSFGYAWIQPDGTILKKEEHVKPGTYILDASKKGQYFLHLLIDATKGSHTLSFKEKSE